jgi:sensor histidine kinase regulating citrate/malate metabolism
MSTSPNSESPEEKPKAKSFEKLTMILAAGALLLSLVNTILILMNPTAGKVEKFNEDLKTELAETIASFHKKVDGLRSAEVEWQTVLKKAKERPDATYKVVNTQDGFLTLTEVQPPEPVPGN